MTVVEDMKLPVPLKVKPSVSKYLDNLEEQGESIYSFQGISFIETFSTLYLLNKYKSKCFARSKSIGLDVSRRPLGLTIPLHL